MRFASRVNSGILLAVAIISLVLARTGHAADIWVAADDPYSSAQFAPGSSSDFMRMFLPNSTWQEQIPGFSTLKIYQAFVGDATDNQLREAISWAQRNHISIAVEGGVLPVASPAQCGWGVEGYNDAFVSQVARIKFLGGTVSDVSMDEPLYFGTSYGGKNACRDSASHIASLVGETFKDLVKIFPSLELTDIEPIPFVGPQLYGDWLSDLGADLPRKLSSFDADVVWDDPYQSDLGAVDDELSESGIQSGAIVDGVFGANTNLSWEASALSNARVVEGDSGTCVGTLVVQTWEPNPSLVLPVDDPGTLSNVARAIGNTYPGDPCRTSNVPEPSSAWVFGAACAIFLGTKWFDFRRRQGIRM